MINVTKTFLPDLNKYQEYVRNIFKSGWITNNGRYVLELEEKLKQYLGVRNIVLVSSGTVALQLAYKLLELNGEIITTPFSFVATTSSMMWEGIKPIFADIDKETFCINSSSIKDRITEKTTGIVPVHVFGNPCEVEKIDAIARKNNLKVIYDAAHAFGVKFKGNSILNYGDISILSFHATKIFHTIEGGALIIKDDDVYEKAKMMINFGIDKKGEVDYIGINAKMNEFEAAMGLCVLENIDEILLHKEKRYKNYVNKFKEYKDIKLQKFNADIDYNYSYFPIVVENERVLKNIQLKLERKKINPRRYFYPSLDNLKYLESTFMKESNDISDRILCLPMGEDVTDDVQNEIVNTVIECLKI